MSIHCKWFHRRLASSAEQMVLVILFSTWPIFCLVLNIVSMACFLKILSIVSVLLHKELSLCLNILVFRLVCYYSRLLSSMCFYIRLGLTHLWYILRKYIAECPPTTDAITAYMRLYFPDLNLGSICMLLLATIRGHSIMPLSQSYRTK